MRGYFRVAPRFGVSMPWWIAIFVLIVWAELALLYWMAVAVLWLLMLAGTTIRRAWLTSRDRRALKQSAAR